MSGPRFAHLTGRRMWERCDHSGTRIEGNPAAVTLAPHLDGDDRPAFDATGMTETEVNQRVENWIETEMRKISPHRYLDAAETQL